MFTMKAMAEAGYNERCFGKGFRGTLHRARFNWIVTALRTYAAPCESILELGCFDGKLLEYLPKKPVRYSGFDAGWEGGLELAQRSFGDIPGYSFRKCTEPAHLVLAPDEQFDVSIAMETFEHIPPPLVDGYLARLARHTRHYCLITVPNEKGPVFLAKWLTKRLVGGEAPDYTLAEAYAATLGRSYRVQRNEHKGFDYAALAAQFAVHFEVLELSGHPLGFLPPEFCFSVGMVGRPRQRSR